MAGDGAVLGIETSCDETAAAVVRGDGTVLSNVVLSQLDDHRPFGGVVPEIAARAHLAYLDSLVQRALDEADTGWAGLEAVAATAGPGLIGGLLVGVMTGRGLALGAGLDFCPINHLEGHALTPGLTDGVDFPYVLLLVSGGHCQLVQVSGVGAYRVLGSTQDDAVGEAFDKTAKLLGLGYPGGPAVEQAAAGGDAQRFRLPRPMQGRNDCRFSFAGLKTAVRRQVEQLGGSAALDAQARRDLAASFQAAVADVLADRCAQALASTAEAAPAAPLVAAGGVAANGTIRQRLAATAAAAERSFVAPPLALCSDQAAMIAWAGCQRRRHLGRDAAIAAVEPRPRWPLESLAAERAP